MLENELLISKYTRAQAIADGSLIDVSGLAKEAGFIVPVAITASVWGEIIVPDDVTKKKFHEDETGRLWDCLHMLMMTIRKSRVRGDTVKFKFLARKNGVLKYVTLTSIILPGDSGEPVITIQYPGED